MAAITDKLLSSSYVCSIKRKTSVSNIVDAFNLIIAMVQKNTGGAKATIDLATSLLSVSAEGRAKLLYFKILSHKTFQTIKKRRLYIPNIYLHVKCDRDVLRHISSPTSSISGLCP